MRCVFPFRRISDRARLRSVVRSTFSLTAWMDCTPEAANQRLNSPGEAIMCRPWRTTGIPDFAHRCTTASGWPRKLAICCQRFRNVGSFFRFGLAMKEWMRTVRYSFAALATSCRPNPMLPRVPEASRTRNGSFTGDMNEKRAFPKVQSRVSIFEILDT